MKLHRSSWKASCAIVIALTISILCKGNATVCGSNVGFVPGDAFFIARLDEQAKTALQQADNSVELTYAYLLDNMEFGGYLGFNRVVISGTDDSLASTLRSAHKLYQHLQTKSKERTSVNGLVPKPALLLIYNREYNWVRYRLGLRHNEDWMSPPKNALKPRGKRVARGSEALGEYDPLIHTFEAAVEDWQQAARVPPLKARVPIDTSWALTGPPLVESIDVKASEVQFVIVDQDAVPACFRREEGQFFVQCAGGKVSVVRFNKQGIDIEESGNAAKP